MAKACSEGRTIFYNDIILRFILSKFLAIKTGERKDIIDL